MIFFIKVTASFGLLSRRIESQKCSREKVKLTFTNTQATFIKKLKFYVKLIQENGLFKTISFTFTTQQLRY
jgi:hypothetical protein